MRRRSWPSSFRPLLAPLALFAVLLSTADGVSAATPPDESPVVVVSGGAIRGRLLGHAGAVFRGVPFAQPPVGTLRWRAPQPLLPWQGVRDALASGPPCAQRSSGWNAAEARASREDCLYLDVWTPEWPARSKKPVMVWIHGGGNTGGAGGSDPLYEGTRLVARGVVLVIVDYRLGPFGFLAHPELTRESDHGSSGNYGLLDIVAALHWVRDNAAAFGGDPGQVTLFGQSAGASDITTLVASPLATGLVQRAISESGSPLYRPPTLAEAERAGERLAARLNAPREGTLAFLRARPAAELLQVAEDGATPNLDGWLLREPAAEAFAAGRAERIPLILGSNAIEFAGPSSADELRNAIASRYGARTPEALTLYGLAGTATGNADPLYGTPGEQWLADTVFRCPSVLAGEWHAATSPVWQYQFDRAIPGKPSVIHSSELPYVFGNLFPHGSQAGRYGAIDRQLSDTMQAYWTNFAKTGDPNGAGLPPWPRFEAPARAYLELTREGGIAVSRGQRRPFCSLFAESLKAPSAAVPPKPPTGATAEDAVPALRYDLQPVAAGTYVAIASGVPYYVANSVVIVGDDGVVVVDSGAGPNEARVLLAAIRTVTDRAVRWLVDTHFHFDHALGNAAFPDAVIVAHEATRELLGPKGTSTTLAGNLAGMPGRIERLRTDAEREEDPRKHAELEGQAAALAAYQKELTGLAPALPTLTFGDRLTLHAAGREIRLLHLGRAHTAGDVVVFLPRERVLCSGDLFNGYIGYMGDAYVGEWADALDRLAALDFETVVPGHGAPFQGKEAIAPVQACLRDIWQQASRLKAEGVPADEAARRIDLRKHGRRFPRFATVGFEPAAVRRIYEVLDAGGR